MSGAELGHRPSGQPQNRLTSRHLHNLGCRDKNGGGRIQRDVGLLPWHRRSSMRGRGGSSRVMGLSGASTQRLGSKRPADDPPSRTL